MLNKIMASTMVPSIVETVWLTRVGFPLGCLSSFRRHLRRHFSKKDKMITGTLAREVSGGGLSVVASEAEDEARSFSNLSGLQTASVVKCKLVLMVTWL